MKKALSTLLLSLTALFLFAQSQPVTWTGAVGNNPARNPQTLPADAPQLAPSDPLLWSQGPDCNAAGTSEIISAYGLVSNCADDFMFTSSKNITTAGWWFAPFNGAYSPFSTWTVTIYDEAACLPGSIVQQWIIPFNMSNEFLYCIGGYYSYWADLTPAFTAAANTKYWISVQAGDHIFPGQWGWAMHAQLTGCEGAFKSAFFGFPDYVPAGGFVFLNPTDFAFELYGTDFNPPVTTPVSNWALLIGIGLILIFAVIRFRRIL